MPRIRLGVALLLPAPAAAEVDVVRRALGVGPSIHRMAPHLTLVPPVNVAEDRLDEAEALVRAAAAATRPITTTLGPPTTFLPSAPVLHLAVGPPEAVVAIEAVRARIFTDPLARHLTWPFVPHVTLVDGGVEQRILAAVSALADLVLDVTFDAVALLNEARDDDGVRTWRPLLESRFAAPAVVGRGGLELALEVGRGLASDAARSLGTWEALDRASGGRAEGVEEDVVVTARRRGVVVAVATGVFRDGSATLERLVVEPAVRGEGVAGHVLAAFTVEAARIGLSRVRARPRVGGPGERFLRDRGWATVATVPGGEAGVDVVVLERRTS